MKTLTAIERVKRLLAIIPWVESQNGPYIEEVVGRFNYPRNELLSDLESVVFFVGIHPFTPDCLIEVSITEEQIWIRYADWFKKPMKLNLEEVIALQAAGQSLVDLLNLFGVENSEELDPLERALTKLALIVGSKNNPIEVELASSVKYLSEVKEALESNSVLEIEYLSNSKNSISNRIIQPERLFADKGNWYLLAYCQAAQEDRTFRLDRLRALKKTDVKKVDIKIKDYSFENFLNSDEKFMISIEIPTEMQWVLEEYLDIKVHDQTDEKIIFSTPVVSEAWLKRLLLRLGPEGRVIKFPEEIEHNIRAIAALEILKRYDS